MNKLIIATIAFACFASVIDVIEATWILGTTAATTGTAYTVSSASAASLGLLGGVVLLKGLILGAAILSQRGRGKRSAGEDTDAAYVVLANSEPAQCYRRLICDLAAGAIPDEENIMSLFNDDVSPISPKFEYATAAKIGKIVKNSQYCEVRYSCPLSTQEIQKLFN